METLVAPPAPDLPPPDFGYLDARPAFPYGRYLKIGALIFLGSLGLYWLRRKAYEAEARRLEEFMQGQAAVHTTFVIEEDESETLVAE